MRKRHVPALRPALLLLLAAPAILILTAEAGAQFVEPDVNTIFTWDGENANDRFGFIVRALGDLDGDGTTDLGITTPFFDAGGANAGKLYIYSGATGDTIRTHVGTPDTFYGYDLAGIGDINGDSLSEYAVAAPGTNTYITFTALGQVFLYDGATGGLLHTWTAANFGDGFGSVIAGGGTDLTQGIGDVDGDGTPDIIIGANLAQDGGPRGAVTVYSGADPDSVLFHRFGGGFGKLFGFGVGSLGDVDGDGFAEIVVGAPNAGPGSVGRVFTYSGLTNTVYLPAFTNNTTGSFLGFLFTKGVGDVDGDGTIDYGATDLTDTTNGTGSGRLYILSGDDGSVLLDLAGQESETFGITRGFGDWDGDGCDDLLVSSLGYDSTADNAGRTQIISGKTGASLRRVTGTIEGDGQGYSTMGVGDIDGDGTPDFMISSIRNDAAALDAGRVYLISGAVPTGVTSGLPGDSQADSRAGFSLRAIRPNPTAGPATIRFTLPHAAAANLAVYDVRGRLVRTLYAGAAEAGDHTVLWDGRNETGAEAASGVYFFKFESPRFEATRKLILNR